MKLTVVPSDSTGTPSHQSNRLLKTAASQRADQRAIVSFLLIATSGLTDQEAFAKDEPSLSYPGGSREFLQ